MINPSVSRKRILIVDDEPEIRKLCQRILTGEGFYVDIAVDGRAAHEMIEEKQYDLCLLDIRMPRMSGIELYQWLQQKYPQLSDRVIFVTGSVMGGDTRDFMEQSGRPFLPKPFTPKELTAIVGEALK